MVDLVSIVIPVYNSEKFIDKTLKAVLHQDYPGAFEVIVVDDGSKDGTAKIVRQYPQIRYAFQENAGPAKARNKGASLARGQIVFFTDSDTVPHQDWLQKSMARFSSGSICAVAGSYDIANPESVLSRCIHQEILYRHKDRMQEFVRAFGTYNVAIRKSDFDAVGGFDEGYRYPSGEDNDLSYKLFKTGKKIYFERTSRVYHYHTEKVAKYLSEQSRHGFWRVKLYKDHPEMKGGDDYTFWKDLVEPPLALLSLGFIVLSLFGVMLDLQTGALFLLMGLANAFLHLTIEIYFGLRIMRNLGDGLFCSWVMFLRSFARTYGFLKGLLFFNFGPSRTQASKPSVSLR